MRNFWVDFKMRKTVRWKTASQPNWLLWAADNYSNCDGVLWFYVTWRYITNLSQKKPTHTISQFSVNKNIISTSASAGSRAVYGCGRSTFGIASSNPAGVMKVCLLCLLCAVQIGTSATCRFLVQRRPTLCVCPYVWSKASVKLYTSIGVGRRGWTEQNLRRIP